MITVGPFVCLGGGGGGGPAALEAKNTLQRRGGLAQRTNPTVIDNYGRSI